LSAVAGIIAGICIVLGSLVTNLVKTPKGAIFNFLGALIGLFGITGIYLWQSAQSGIFGVVAYVWVFVGLGLIACIDYFGGFMSPSLPEEEVNKLGSTSAMMVLTISGLIFLVGEILFGISIITTGIFSTIAAVLFMIGFIATPLRQVYPIVTFIGSILSGAGIIWWSLSLWSMAGGI
jgi:hypothetical protein